MSVLKSDLVAPGAEVLNRLACALPHLRHLLTPHQPLHDLGFDSLDLVELLCVIESEFNVRVTEGDLAAAATVGELAAAIAARGTVWRTNP